MRCTLFLSLFVLGACKQVPYTPTEQEFDAQDEDSLWGNGIPGFNPYGTVGGGGTTDTGNSGGGGSVDVDGIYMGTYSVSIYNQSTGMNCSCSSASLTMAIQAGGVQVGQGQQCLTDCSTNVMLNFTGSVAGDGTAMGQADDNNDYGFSSPWTGLFSSGIATGTISGASIMLTNQGATGDVTGSFTLTQQ